MSMSNSSDFDVENIPVKFQYVVGNLWGVIEFTRCCYLLPIWLWTVQNGQTTLYVKIIGDFDVENILITLQQAMCEEL